jgi:HD-GYP domain-containing protein (c-di-GMP phosphodiesterase class II)
VKKSGVKFRWDVFISHASEDKIAFARPLAEALSAKGLRVWYDDFALKVGDSLRESIDHGLINSRYGIVILSPNFFAKDWPRKELNGLATREVGKKKVILPIWHAVGVEDVRSYSALLADRIAITTDKGLEYVVESLLRVLSPPRKPSVSVIPMADRVRNLETLLAARTEQWQSAMRELERSYDISLEMMGEGLDLKTGNTDGHSKRVTVFTIVLARAMGIPDNQITVIARGAFLHDIGKTTIPESILRKPEPLTAQEEAQLRQYCRNGYEMLSRVPFLEEAAKIVYAQEERFDGRGYPRELKGEEIPIGARLLAVAHVIEDFSSGDAQTLVSAQDWILRQSRIRFDPLVVKASISVPLEVWQKLRDDIRLGMK